MHEYLFYLLILLLPVQLGRHFWPQFSFVFGLPVDYLSPTLYLTDILVIGMVLSWGIGKIKNQKSKIKITNQNLKILLLISFFSLVNVFFAESRGVAVYYWLKYLEFFLLGFYIARSHVRQGVLSKVLAWAVICSSLVAFGQFLNRGSLGGIFWWLGERTFTVVTPGIARVRLFGRLFLRPYASFPHPNVLAGFLLVSLALVVSFYQKKKGLVFWLALSLGAAVIFLSFSQVVWLVSGVIGLIIFQRRFRSRRVLVLSSLLFVLLLIWFLASFPLEPLSISRRLDLARASLLMIGDYPIFGVGLGNFLVCLPDYYQSEEGVRFFQPVHNIFLLVAAETGLVGVSLFLVLIIMSLKNLLSRRKPRMLDFTSAKIGNWKLVIPFLVILLTGMADHYWLTLQQGQLLSAFVLGLAWRSR